MQAKLKLRRRQLALALPRLLPAKLLGFLLRQWKLQRQKPRAQWRRSLKGLLQLYLILNWRRLPRPEPILSRRWQPGMRSQFLMTMQKENRRSPKRRKQQLLMMIGREVGQNDQKCPSARRSSAALWRAPRILQPQGYSRVNSLTKSFSITPKASMCLLLEMPSSRFSRRILRFAPANLRLLGCLAPTCCGKNLGKPASFE